MLSFKSGWVKAIEADTSFTGSSGEDSAGKSLASFSMKI